MTLPKEETNGPGARHSPRRSKRLLSMGAALAMLAIASVICVMHHPEPKYKGKRVSAWFAQELRLGPGMIVAGPSGVKVGRPASSEALDAFKHLGASAVPFLISALQAEESLLRRKYMVAWAHLPEFARHRLPMLHDASRIRATAAYLLIALGPEARNAVPSLMQNLTSPEPRVRENALVALASIGPDAADAIPALKLLLQDPDHWTRTLAATALARIDPASTGETELESPPLK